jgi:magnesium transporter
MQISIAYNDNEVKQSGTKEDINNGYKLWLDAVDPTSSEIQDLRQTYGLDKKALEVFTSKSKKPQIRMSDAHIFTLILDIKYKDLKTLATEGHRITRYNVSMNLVFINQNNCNGRFK